MMPSFYEKNKLALRSQDEGADTITWLCGVDDLPQSAGGGFFFDRQKVRTHMPMAWTKESAQDREVLWNQCMAWTGQEKGFEFDPSTDCSSESKEM